MQALVLDRSSPWFTTPHFDGHLSGLVRASRREVDVDEVTELVREAWLSRTSSRRARAWPERAQER